MNEAKKGTVHVPFSYCSNGTCTVPLRTPTRRGDAHFGRQAAFAITPDQSSVLEVSAHELPDHHVGGSLHPIRKHGVCAASHHTCEGHISFDISDDLHLWIVRNRLRAVIDAEKVSMVAGLGIHSCMCLLGLSRIFSSGDHSRQKRSSETELYARILGHCRDRCILRPLRWIHSKRGESLLPDSGGDRIGTRDPPLSRAHLRTTSQRLRGIRRVYRERRGWRRPRRPCRISRRL